ncbi:MAG: aminotransferase class I/II-fold pyridoxal phosphate-dependent enzyme [Candidatus Heimdallarchaeota archaeon]|nr:aminotransferase class I/II-fold pyridoxal phosphate-dependent enzyme [Candidatus Heimdallarchaeota archaeon]MDH5645477.1 aminotransferase class I/II-fold pyridoxal phosphate-dependent enzyme [Candidatus Heimdallarchaeota archaeon]
MRISNRVNNIEYAIRDVQTIANKIKEQGHSILQFNIGDPLKFDYEVPSIMQDTLRSQTQLGYYSDSTGDLDVRQKIADYENAKQNLSISNNDVIYFQGVSEGMLFSLLSFLNPGDRILVPGPTYPAYQSIGTAADAEIVAYRCIEEEDWNPDIDDLRSKLTTNTKIVVVINPNNPTGAVYSESTLKKIRDVVGESGATILSDEIYDKLVLEGNYTSYSSITNDVPAIVFNGFSKVYLAPGYRAAYGYVIDTQDQIQDAWEGVRKLCRVRLSPSTPISKAAVAGLSLNPPHLAGLIEKVKSRRDLVVKRLGEIDRISTVIPKAAFYIFPKLDLQGTKWKNDKEFVLDLLQEKHTLMVFGSGFGQEFGKDHFRMVYLANEEVLNEGLTRLADFLQ